MQKIKIVLPTKPKMFPMPFTDEKLYFWMNQLKTIKGISMKADAIYLLKPHSLKLLIMKIRKPPDTDKNLNLSFTKLFSLNIYFTYFAFFY